MVHIIPIFQHNPTNTYLYTMEMINNQQVQSSIGYNAVSPAIVIDHDTLAI